MSFNPNWLDERFIHDLRARNVDVQHACLNHFNDRDAISIVDVGSGTGSTLLALYDKIDKDQYWTFLEEDPILIAHSLQRIKGILQSEGYTYSKHHETIAFRNKRHTIRLHTINDSLLHIDTLMDLGKVDLLTASAIFDLFSIEQYAEFVENIHQHSLAVLSVLNYTGMHFSPIDSSDAEMVSLYNGHMRRPQDFGIGMGAQCQSDIVALYNSLDKKIISGASIWNLSPEHTRMHSMILDYMKAGVGAMTDDPAQLDLWLRHKRHLSDQGELTISVNHFDYFVI